jgi:hypothetical protein
VTKFFSVVAVGIATLTAGSLAGQSKPGSLQGVWQAVEVTLPGPTPRTIRLPQPPPNLTIITAKHYSRVQVDAEGPRPIPADIAKASADELRAVWGPFVGEAGTYEISGGNMITMRPVVAKNPAAMKSGAFTTWSYRLEGDTLWVTAKTNQSGPVDPVTIKAVRIE